MAKTTYMLVLIAAAFMSGCGTAKVKVVSQPDKANVAVVTAAGEEKSIGTTPLEMETNKLHEACGDTSGPCRLMVSKKGYARESLFVGATYFRQNFSARVKLEPTTEWLDLEKSDTFLGRLNDVAHYTAKLQEQTLKGDYSAALETAKHFVSSHPKVSVAWDLLGNIYYLKKMYGQAGDAYKRSLALNPNNVETQKIVKFLRDKKGATQ